MHLSNSRNNIEKKTQMTPTDKYALRTQSMSFEPKSTLLLLAINSYQHL